MTGLIFPHNKLIMKKAAAGGPVPADIASLFLHLDAAIDVFRPGGSTPSINGQGVSVWGDQSGNGFDFDADSTSQEPTLYTGIVNGLPVLRGYSSSTWRKMVGPNMTGSDGTAGDIFACLKVDSPSSNGTGRGNLFGFTTGNLSHYSYIDGQIYDGTMRSIRALTIADPPDATMESFHLVNITSATNLEIRINGTSEGSSAGGSYGLPTAPFLFGSSSSRYAEVDMAEFVMFSEELSAGDRTDMETYFNDKYSLGF